MGTVGIKTIVCVHISLLYQFEIYYQYIKLAEYPYDMCNVLVQLILQTVCFNHWKNLMPKTL